MAGSLLLVDDEPGIREGLSEYLFDQGFNISVAASEEEAWRVFKDHRPSVVLSDLMLENGSGLSLFQRLKRSEEGGGPFCILMTGYGTLENAVEALRVGADDFLTKPLRMPDLDRAIANGLATYEMRFHRSLGQGPLDRLAFEMNAPLSRVRTYLQMLREGRFGALSTVQNEKLGSIQSSLGQMLGAVRNMRLEEAGKLPAAFFENLDPGQLLLSAQQAYFLDFERKGVTVAQSKPMALPRVMTDRRYAGALIDMLLSRSLGSLPPGSELRLEWGLIERDLCLSVTGWPVSEAVEGDDVWLRPEVLALFARANLALDLAPKGAWQRLRFLGTLQAGQPR